MVFSAPRAQHAFFNLQFSKYVKNEGECFDSSLVPNTKKNYNITKVNRAL